LFFRINIHKFKHAAPKFKNQLNKIKAFRRLFRKVRKTGGITKERVRSFDTFTSDFIALGNYLKQKGISTVAMEATGVYWVVLLVFSVAAP
jgi:purine-nucleoside phosphorylase